MDEQVKNFNADEDALNLFFDSFIKKGEIIDSKEIIPGFTVEMKVLNTGEMIAAETISLVTNNFPKDIVAKVRAASILSQAILSINKISVVKENDEQKTISIKRANLYSKLLDMPAVIVQKTYEYYIELFNKQNAQFDNTTAMFDMSENFSKHPSEK